MGHPQRNEVFRDVGSRLHEPLDADFIEIKSSRSILKRPSYYVATA